VPKQVEHYIIYASSETVPVFLRASSNGVRHKLTLRLRRSAFMQFRDSRKGRRGGQGAGVRANLGSNFKTP